MTDGGYILLVGVGVTNPRRYEDIAYSRVVHQT